MSINASVNKFVDCALCYTASMSDSNNSFNNTFLWKDGTYARKRLHYMNKYVGPTS